MKHGPNRLVSDAEVGGQGAEALGSGNRADGGFLNGCHLADAMLTPGGIRSVVPRVGMPPRGVRWRSPEVGHRNPEMTLEQVLQVLDRSPSVPGTHT